MFIYKNSFSVSRKVFFWKMCYISDLIYEISDQKTGNIIDPKGEK